MRRNSRKGQALLLSIVLLAVVFGLSGAFMSYIKNVQTSTNVFSSRAEARNAAQAGIDKAIWCLNQSSGTNCGGTYSLNYAGETGILIGSNGYFTTTIATGSGVAKTITSTGYYPSVTKPISVVTLKADVGITTESASFFYGVQSGRGGFLIDPNAYIVGNVYANGDVTGASGAYATGDVWVAGGTALSPDQEQTTNDSDYTFGRTSPQIDIAQSFKLSDDNVVNQVSFYVKKVGSPSSATINILADNAGVPSKTVVSSVTLPESSVSTSYGWVDISFATPPGLVGGTTYWLSIDSGSDSSDYWIIGSLTNNGYGNGVGMYSAKWDAASPVWASAGRDFAFKVWTGGVTTKIDGFHVKGNAHANTITGSTVDKDAYYQTLTSSTVTGTEYPGSIDPGPQDFPFADSQIADLKTAATNGGTHTGSITLDDASDALGPEKIVGDLTITNGAVLTMTGTLYVTGNLDIDNNAIVRLDSGYGSSSGGFVVDGKINISNNVTFQGSGTAGSYVMLITTNSSLDSDSPAMELSNNSANSIFYAPNGLVEVGNNATMKEITAFKLHLDNNASVTYESGLANVNFSSGPGASWILSPGSVRETH